MCGPVLWEPTVTRREPGIRMIVHRVISGITVTRCLAERHLVPAMEVTSVTRRGQPHQENTPQREVNLTTSLFTYLPSEKIPHRET